MSNLVKRKFEVKEYDRYFIDEVNNNKISMDKVSKYEAELILLKLRERQNYNCINCSYCINCIDCKDSHYCIDCSDIEGCHFCIELHNDKNRHNTVGKHF